MTREEAIKNLKELIDTYITCHGEEDTVAVSLDNVDVEALDMAIKALEQAPTAKNNLGKVLDKVYAEIEELQRDMLYASKVEFNDIYKILDKYKAESEG